MNLQEKFLIERAVIAQAKKSLSFEALRSIVEQEPWPQGPGPREG